MQNIKTNLTSKEADLLKRIIESDFHDGADPIGNAVWSVCENKSDNAVMNSLIKKELAGSQRDADGVTCWITQTGFDAYDAATNPLHNIEEMEAAIDTAVDALIDSIENPEPTEAELDAAAIAKADEQLAEINTIIEAKKAEEQEIKDIIREQDAEAKKAEKAPKKTSPRYEEACAEVSRTNKAFMEALDEKAALLGTVRVGESVGVYSHPDAAGLNEQIRKAREVLDGLLAQKRALKTNADGLGAINEKVSRFRKERDAARWMKKLAAAELETA